MARPATPVARARWLPMAAAGLIAVAVAAQWFFGLGDAGRLTAVPASGALQAGQCLLESPSADRPIVVTSCHRIHAEEVVATRRLPRSAYPGLRAVAAAARKRCLSALPAPLAGGVTSGTYALTASAPGPGAWRAGDRLVTCRIGRLDGRPLVAPVAADRP